MQRVVSGSRQARKARERRQKKPRASVRKPKVKTEAKKLCMGPMPKCKCDGELRQLRAVAKSSCPCWEEAVPWMIREPQRSRQRPSPCSYAYDRVVVPSGHSLTVENGQHSILDHRTHMQSTEYLHRPSKQGWHSDPRRRANVILALRTKTKLKKTRERSALGIGVRGPLGRVVQG